MHSIRHWASFFVGVVIFILGLLPLIGKAPAFLTSLPVQVLSYIVAFGGLYIIVDSFFEFTFHSGLGITALIVGVIVFGIGLINVLNSFGILAFKLPLATIFYQILFMLEGLFLMMGCFVMD